MTTKDYILNTLRTQKKKLNQYGVQRVGLFGSYLMEQQSENSDIDILIEFSTEGESFDNLMFICDFLEILFKDEKIDIVTKNGLSPYIGPEILKEVLYV